MPRFKREVLPGLRGAVEASEKHRPRTKRYVEERPGGWQRVT